MSKTILVGLDGSPRQPKVLEQALALADAFDGRLHLARAMTIPISIPAAAWTLQGEDFSRFLAEHGYRELQETAAALASPRIAELHCRVGQPHDVLVALAGELHADLVIIGSHGYEGVDRLLGTTAGKVVNRAPCSVLVVR